MLLGITVTFACLKTAIGLITSCASTFTELFPRTLSYRAYAIVFCLFSFGVANFGLSRIIQLSLPVLMFLYPLTITLILLALGGRWFGYDRRVFTAVTIPTVAAAALDLLNALPDGAKAALHAQALLEPARRLLPFFILGMGLDGARLRGACSWTGASRLQKTAPIKKHPARGFRRAGCFSGDRRRGS